MEIRDARPDEFDELGDVRVAAYRADGFLSPQSTYAHTLRALGADGRSVVLVAVADQGSASSSAGASSTASGSAASGSAASGSAARSTAASSTAANDSAASGSAPSSSGATSSAEPDSGPARIVGTVMLQHGPAPGETVAGPGEAEIRALAVTAEARGAGVGEALLSAIIDRAAASGVEHLVLLTQPGMKAAQHLYERAGFVRLPERDWSPEPGLVLLAYGLVLRT